MIKRRSSFVTVIDNTNKGGLAFLFLLLIDFLVENGFSNMASISFIIYILIAVAAISIALFVINLIIWRITYFCYDGEQVILERKGLIKKRLTIPIDKISTIDIKKNILGHLTGTSRIKIDSGNIRKGEDDDGAEINLIFDDKFAYEIRNTILVNNETSENENKFVMNITDFIVEGLLRRKLIHLAFFLFSIYLLLFGVLGDKIKSGIKSFFSLPMMFSILIIFLTIVGTNVISVITEILKYHNFTLYKQNNALITEFGFFLKQTYTLPIDKIKSVVLTQNMLFRLFGYYSVNVVCTGFGDEKKEKSILFPLAKRDKANQILSLVNPVIAEEKVYSKVPYYGKPYYFIPSTILLFLSLITLLVLVIINVKIIYLLPLLIVTLFTYILSFLCLVNTGLYYNNKIICTTSGFFTKKETIIFINQVQGVKKHEAFYKKKVCNLTINYYPGISNPTLSNMDIKHYTILYGLFE